MMCHCEEGAKRLTKQSPEECQTAALHYYSGNCFVAAARLLPMTLFFLLLELPSLHAQLLIPTGGNHPELHWQEIETDHFRIVYHDGLDTIARKAAPVAEEVYRVVTTNLKTPVSKRIKIYLSDYDEIKNAFAFED